MKDGDAIARTQFAIVPVWVAELGAHAILVYFALASFATYTDDRACYPSQATIAGRAGISERSVRTALKVLREAGALICEERTRENGSRASNLYRLLSDRPDSLAAPARQEVPGGQAPPAAPEREGSDLTGPDLLESGRARENSTIAGKVGGSEHVGKVVLGKRLTAAELHDAQVVVHGFNRIADRKVTLASRENVRMVVGRMREHPDLQPGDWESIIEANLAEPWWDGPPSLNVIFSPRVFHIAMERGKEWVAAGWRRPRRNGEPQTFDDLAAMEAELREEASGG